MDFFTSTIREADSRIKFPCLRKTLAGSIILFTDSTTGTFVASPNRGLLGTQVNSYDTYNTEEFKGTVELSNE